MQKNPDCVLGGGRYDKDDAADTDEINSEFDQICAANLANFAKFIRELVAIRFAKPPPYPPP